MNYANLLHPHKNEINTDDIKKQLLDVLRIEMRSLIDEAIKSLTNEIKETITELKNEIMKLNPEYIKKNYNNKNQQSTKKKQSKPKLENSTKKNKNTVKSTNSTSGSDSEYDYQKPTKVQKRKSKQNLHDSTLQTVKPITRSQIRSIVQPAGNSIVTPIAIKLANTYSVLTSSDNNDNHGKSNSLSLKRTSTAHRTPNENRKQTKLNENNGNNNINSGLIDQVNTNTVTQPNFESDIDTNDDTNTKQ